MEQVSINMEQEFPTAQGTPMQLTSLDATTMAYLAETRASAYTRARAHARARANAIASGTAYTSAKVRARATARATARANVKARANVIARASANAKAIARACHEVPFIKQFDSQAQTNVDIVGPLPVNERFPCLLTVVDRFFRWPDAITIKGTQNTAAKWRNRMHQLTASS